jgi:hypothetical protein
MWSTANLLNLVENSLAGRPVSWDLALRAGGLTSALFVLQLCMFDVMQHTSTYLNVSSPQSPLVLMK